LFRAPPQPRPPPLLPPCVPEPRPPHPLKGVPRPRIALLTEDWDGCRCCCPPFSRSRRFSKARSCAYNSLKVIGSTHAAIDDTTPLYSESSPARIYELNSSSSNFFPADVISSAKAFILAIYSAIVDDPF
jgi:hypothetical protein